MQHCCNNYIINNINEQIKEVKTMDTLSLFYYIRTVDKTQAMKKISLLFTILCAFPLHTFAQAEIKRDSIAAETAKLLPNLDNQLEQNVQHEAATSAKVMTPDEIERRAKFVEMLNFKAPYFYEEPPLENESLNPSSPFAYDFSHGGYQILNEDFYLTGAAYRRSYPTLGGIHSTALMLNYRATEWLDIAGGMYGTKFVIDGHQMKDFGFDASIRFKLHERLYIRAHGRYSVTTDENRDKMWRRNTMNMYPQTYYGAGAQFKINDNVGIEGGLIREYNPATRKWKNVPYIMPVMFKIGGR